MSTLRLLISDSYDPWFNLAVEECIFRQMPATQRVLFLWRNADTVVIGRAQNPWKECNTRRMEEDNVRLARRSSGGGAVFHDLGNTCFTFMAGKPEYDKTISTSIVLNALNALGVSAEASGRNDLVVKTAEGDRKVSGSAYRETKDRGFHHGTLLLNADLSRLANYLNPDKKKLAAKGINTRRMEEDNVRLARRSSGGGAVFHDLGNTCFTFMAGKPEYDKTISTSIVLNALNALGVSAEASGRNDLVVKTAEGDRKVSGSAYRETKDRGFHHGTLLLNADLSRLANYLNPDKKKLAAKGITSVRSRVTNLTELLPGITHEQVCEAITKAFFAHYGERVEAEIISPDKTPDLPNFAETFARQSSWEWNFGQAPAFSHLLDERFSWGGVELHFDVEKGHITRAQVFTDSLNPAPLEALAGRLQGCLYRADMLQQECEALLVDFPDQEKELRKLSTWIAGAVR